jgi:DNA-binding CsgD family transcriptional regulator
MSALPSASAFGSPTLASNLATNLNTTIGLGPTGPGAIPLGCCPNCGHKLPHSMLSSQHTGIAGTIAPPPARLDLLSRLSDAQRRVLYHLLAGLTEPQIATKVNRSRHTVHDHTKAIYAALNVQRRVQLVHLFTGTDPLAILPPEDRAAAASASFAEPRDIANPSPPGAVPITDAIRREAALRVV